MLTILLPQKKIKRLILVAIAVAASLVALGGFEQQAVKAASSWRGASFPVENFRAYTSLFGYRPSPTDASGWEFHRGLDIAAPEGSYIRNWWMGKVVEVSDNTLCGTSITIQSGQWRHIYCHMKGHVEKASAGQYLIDREGGIQIWQGGQIATGARIGRVGMTGRTTGPHLHWGLKYANNYVDPAEVLRQMYGQAVKVKQGAGRQE